ncbi:MAG TPA: response regulator [Candidatus Angelobacter sp.]|nr:response regulator [Candidatus Angelobacter sp.]
MPPSAVRYARVLAIDDSPEFLSILNVFFDANPDLKLVGTAQNGREALRLVEELHPDLVLMDLQMAEMNGLEATSEIRSRFPEIEVVIVTAHDIPGLRQVCCDNGASDFIAKPRLHRELPDVLARFLARLN